MRPIHVITCRGIGETLGQNMLQGNGAAKGVRQYLEEIRPGRFHFIDAPWPASYGPAGRGNGEAYAANLAGGEEIVYGILKALPRDEPRVLLGYSGGAALAGNVANRDQRLDFVGLVADPLRPHGAGVPPYTAPDFGISGQRNIDRPFPAWWIADPMDPITSLPANSPLRTVADQTYAMSFTPGGFPDWMRDLVEKLLRRQFQAVAIDWRDPGDTLALYTAAADALRRYLWGGDHTQYAFRDFPGTRLNMLSHLANRIIWTKELFR